VDFWVLKPVTAHLHSIVTFAHPEQYRVPSRTLAFRPQLPQTPPSKLITSPGCCRRTASS